MKRLLRKGYAGSRDAEANLREAVAERIDDLSSRFPWLSLQVVGKYVPRVDVVQTEDRMLVTAEIPGTRLPNVAISCNGRILTIEGEKRESNGEDNGARKFRSERAYGAFRRTIRLPARSRGTAFDATHEDGVLSVWLPKDNAVHETVARPTEPDPLLDERAGAT